MYPLLLSDHTKNILLFSELISRDSLLNTESLQSDLQCSSDKFQDVILENNVDNSTPLRLLSTRNIITGLPETPQDVKYQNASAEQNQKSRKTVEKFKNHADLVSFIESENKLREIDGKVCFTKKLDRFQWHMLQNSISSYISKLVKLSDKGDKVRYDLYLKKARRTINLTIS